MLNEVEEVEEEVIAKERNITTTTTTNTTNTTNTTVVNITTTPSLATHQSKTREENFKKYPTLRGKIKVLFSSSDFNSSRQPTKKMFKTFKTSLTEMLDTSIDSIHVYFVPLLRIVNNTTTNNTATLMFLRFQSIDRGRGSSDPISRSNMTNINNTAFLVNYEIQCASIEEVSHAQHQNRVITGMGGAAAFQKQLSLHGMNVTINEITPLPSLPPLRPRVSPPPPPSPAILADNTTSLMTENISNSVRVATNRMSALQNELKKTMEEEQYVNQTAIQEEEEAAVLENETVSSERKVRGVCS